MTTTQLELTYQRDEKEWMKEEAGYALNKGEITSREYEKRILRIILGYEEIVEEILAYNN